MKDNLQQIKTVHLLMLFLLMFSLTIKAEQRTIRQQDVSFTSRGTELSGTIVQDTSQKNNAAIIFVHGSGAQARSLKLATQFAQAGIVTLVYDKRGVGESGGEYESEQSVSEKNLRLLADDAVAASEFLHAHPWADSLPIGITGISQAGWIIPLAVQKTKTADFVVIWSGPVCKVSEEDIYSKYTRDKDGGRFSNGLKPETVNQVPSFAEALNARQTPYRWPDFLGEDIDASKTLQSVSIPGLWIFGGLDGSVPVDLSIARLQQLKAQQHPFDYVLFSYLGHNNMTNSFTVAADWIKQQQTRISAP